MKELPDDLATMEANDLVQQGVVRDELLAPLFRRWPGLSHVELVPAQESLCRASADRKVPRQAGRSSSTRRATWLS